MAIVRLRPEDLKRAIAGGTLSLQFQPQVHVPTGKLVGAEAFARWPHPSYGMIGPGEIIALIEQGALHVDFDRWVLTELCAQQNRVRKSGPPKAKLTACSGHLITPTRVPSGAITQMPPGPVQ